MAAKTISGDLTGLETLPNEANELVITGGNGIWGGSVTGGTHGDTVSVSNNIMQGFSHNQPSVSLGGGDDKLTVGETISDANIDLGEGDNTLSTGGSIIESSITLGGGSNFLYAGDSFNGSTIVAGDGDDTIHIEWNVMKVYQKDSEITLGDGNNRLTIDGYLQNSGIVAGAGNDLIDIGCSSGIGDHASPSAAARTR